jgi:hypothetical protein
MALTQQYWTFELVNDSITITSDFAFSVISVVLTTGTGTILGSLSPNGISSTPLTLLQNLTVTFGAGTPYPLEGITIDTTGGGIVYIIAR